MKRLAIAVLCCFLAACATRQTSKPGAVVEKVDFPFRTLLQGTELGVGGFSGLQFEGTNANGEWLFLTLTDRGPNADDYRDPKTGHEMRPFVKPDYTPRFIRFAVDRKEKTVRELSEVLLRFPNGKPMTGLPNLEPNTNRSGDEIPVNTRGEVIAMDLMGIDPEGICVDPKGFIWMSEEYRPSLLKFTKDGQLIRRYVPKGSFTPAEIQKIDQDYGRDLVMQVLPEIYKARKRNRGLEALTCLDGKLLAMLQSPLKHEKTNVRLLEFDPIEEEVTREFSYPLESKKADKIGDMAAFGKDLYVIEQDSETGPESFHQVFRVNLSEAQDKVLKKTLVVDLVKAGYSFAEKIEGIALIDAQTMVVLNDNDFGLSGELNKAKGEAPLAPHKRTVLGVIPIAAPPSQ